MTRNDLSYLAGIIDGEGHIEIHCDNRIPSFYLRIIVVSTSEELMFWLKEKFGGHYYPRTWNELTRKQCYAWQVSTKQSEEMLKKIFPFLIIKKRQAKLALEFRKTVGKQGKKLSEKVCRERTRIAKEMKLLNRRYPEQAMIGVE